MRRALVLLSVVALLVSAASVNAVSKILTVTHVKEVEAHFCVPASVTMEIKSEGLALSKTQYELYDEAVPYKKCSQSSLGLDPRAWAWSLYMNTPADRFYDDYVFSTAYDGTRAMLEQQWFDGEVAGALVNEGHHAVVFQGADTSCNPTQISCENSVYTINTVYINDPWYNRSGDKSPGGTTCQGTDRGSGASYPCGVISLKSNASGNSTAIAYSGMWAKYYFTKWGHQPAACDDGGWNGKWVAVLRKSSGQPTAVGPAVNAGEKDPSMAPSQIAPMGPSWSTTTVEGVTVVADDSTVEALDAAIDVAAKKHGLWKRQDFTTALTGAHVKAVHSVRSLSADFPDYVVAEIAGPHGTKGLALFLAKGDDYVFGGLTLDEAYLHILPPAQAIHAAGGNPSSASAELVWGWSAASGSPFYPLYAVDSPAGTQYVDMSGDVVDSLELR